MKRKKEVDESEVEIPEGYYTNEMAIEYYGEDMLKKMDKTGWLNGVTGIMLKDGTLAIPSSDYERAYRAVKGDYIANEEWD